MADTTKAFVEYEVTEGAYHIVVRHANHLPVMSAEAQGLSVSSSTVYDFSLALAQAYGPEPMEQVTTSGPTRYALIAGNASWGDIRVNAADRQVVKNQLGLTGYRAGDLNLSGTVNAAGPIIGPDEHGQGDSDTMTHITKRRAHMRTRFSRWTVLSGSSSSP